MLPKKNLTQKRKQFKKLKQKVDAHCAKFLIDGNNLSKKYGIIFCEQISWITRSTKWVRLAKCTWSCSASSDSNNVDPRIFVMSLLYSWTSSTVNPVTLIFDQYSLLGAENNQSHTCPHPQLLANTCTMSTRAILVSVFFGASFWKFLSPGICWT